VKPDIQGHARKNHQDDTGSGHSEDPESVAQGHGVETVRIPDTCACPEFFIKVLSIKWGIIPTIPS
jgi:hypothetical protein